jgi:hypothetical protein
MSEHGEEKYLSLSGNRTQIKESVSEERLNKIK